jgi:hypothetical protein
MAACALARLGAAARGLGYQEWWGELRRGVGYISGQMTVNCSHGFQFRFQSQQIIILVSHVKAATGHLVE